MHNFSKDFFKIIDTEQKAYILGFIYADGYNSGRQLSLDQLEQDQDILEQILKALNGDHKIQKRIQENEKVKTRLCFSSTELCSDLSKLGAIPNKSLVLSFPSYEIVPKNLMRHFIRGYFDGDGCIWNGKRKKMLCKDSTRKSGFRERIVHNVKFTFTGANSFIEPLQDFLVQEGIVNKKTKLNTSKRKTDNDKFCTMEYSGRLQIGRLFDFMYHDATIFGNRKYSKFLEILCAQEEKFSQDTSLIAGKPEMAISSQAFDDSNEGSTTIPEMGVESSDSKCEAPNE